MSAASKFLSDDGMRMLPIACRLVPLDQWLVTHVDTSWKVKVIKQWILSKCNIWGSSGAPQPPRFRPPSPVTFSSFSRRSSLDSESWAGTEEGAEDDWDAFAAVDYNAELRASDAALASSSLKSQSESEAMVPSSFYIPSQSQSQSQPQQQSSSEREFEAASAQFTLVSFSNGFILEDDADLSWYKPRPFELFEVHRAGAIVSLPRNGIAYAEPYFESPVRVSDRPHGKRPARTSEDQQMHALEWKPRWAIIRDGVLHLCKEAHLPPTHRFPLSALCALHGPEQLGLGGGEKDASSKTICAKFTRTSISGNVAIGESDGGNFSGSQGRKKPKSSSWVLLDMPNRSSFENLLRVLHRLAPHPLQSSFVLSRVIAASPTASSSRRHKSRSSVILPSPAESERSYDSSPSSFFGIQYPEWRLALLQRCLTAGHSSVGSALSLAQAHSLIANSDSHELFHQPLPRAPSISEGLRRRAEQLSSSALSDSELASKRSGSSVGHSWRQALSEGDDEEDEDDEAESEVEWEGWVRDLSRRPTRPSLFTSSSEGARKALPASPSSSEADNDFAESGGTARVRTLSCAAQPLRPTSSPRARSSTVSAAGTIFGSTYTSTTTTTITTYIDRVPELRTPSSSSGPGSWTQHSFAAPVPSPSSPTSSSPRNVPRALRVRNPTGSPVTGASMRMTPPQSASVAGSRAPSVSGSEMGSSVGDGSGGNSRSSGIKRIVRGVSIRNAFSTERLVRGFEDALDFVDGR